MGENTMCSDLGRFRRCFQPRQWFAGEGEPDPFVVQEEDVLMWVYKRVGEGYQVGFYSPLGEWIPEGTFATAELAAARVNYLNGGTRPPIKHEPTSDG